MIERFIIAHSNAIDDLRRRAAEIEVTKAYTLAEQTRQIEDFNMVIRRLAKLEARVASARQYMTWKANEATKVVFAEGTAP
jgi:alkylation response protein AidB-like acyl-CoA dehydrogenase